MKRDVPLSQAGRLLNDGPVTLVTVALQEKVNVLSVGWTTPLGRDPLLVGIVVSPQRYSYELIRRSEEFIINIPGPDLVRQVHYFGVVSGERVNKFEQMRTKLANPRLVSAPVITDCLAHLECTLVNVVELKDHHLFVGQVVAAEAEEDAFDQYWILKERDYSPLHYLGGNVYATLGQKGERIIVD